MASHVLDTRGLKCPVPILKVNLAVRELGLKSTDTLDVLADCVSFEKDIKDWANERKKVIQFIKDEKTYKVARIVF